RFAGAGYLVWLGGKAMTDLWRARRHRAATGPALRPANGWSPFLHGLVTNGLNPKAVLFFLTFLPQFVTPAAPAGGQILLLGGIVVALAAAWWVGYVLAADRVAPLLRRPRV